MPRHLPARWGGAPALLTSREGALRFSKTCALALCVAACAEQPAAQPPSAPTTPAESSSAPAMTSSSSPPSTPTPAAPRKTLTLNGATPGERVALRGRVSRLPAQHVISGVAGKKFAYFDLPGDEQTIVYWKEPPFCSVQAFEVTGSVLEVKGLPGSKAEGTRELHVDVDSARCL